MFKFFKPMLMATMLSATAISGCIDSTATQMVSSADGRFTSYQMLMTYKGSTRWVVLATDARAGGQIVANFGGETLTLGRQLVENMMSPGVLASLISGAAGIHIADKGSCGSGVCGTIIYTSAVSGSQADAGATADATAGIGGVHKSSKGGGDKDLSELKKVFTHALKTAY